MANLPFHTSDNECKHDLKASRWSILRLFTKKKILPAPTEQTFRARVSVALRSLSFKIFPVQRSNQEEKKVAIENDRLNAIIRCMVHIVPLAGAMTLLFLNFSWYYVGDSFSSQGLAALQFAAKLHEITMISSITTAFISYVRYEVTTRTGLPFGALLASLQVTQLTYLWSPELLGSMASKSYDWKFKLRLGLAIISVSLLIATVGPASAATMIPREAQWFEANALVAVDATEDTFFPTDLGIGLYKNESCIGNTISSFDSQERDNFCSWSHDLGSQYNLMSLQNVIYGVLGSNGWQQIPTTPWHTTSSWFGLLFGFSFTLSSERDKIDPWYSNVATSIQAQSLPAILMDVLEDNDIWISQTMDAFSRVQCFENSTILWNTSEPEPILIFTVLQTQINITTYLTPAEREIISQANNASRQAYSEIFFIDTTNLNVNGIVLILNNYDYIGEGILDPSQVQITPCVLEMGWFSTHLRMSKNIASSSSGPPSQGSAEIHHAKADKAWLASSNPFLDEANSTAFRFMTGNAKSSAVDLAYIISALITVTLSAMSPANLTSGIILFELSYYGTPNGTNGGLQGSFDLSMFHYIQSLPLHFPQKIYRSGYGYGPNVITVKVSLAVLIIYCIVALTHITYLIATGISSTAWDSISEILALAMNSRPASELQNTCAGIQTTRVFEHKVRIATTAGDTSTQASGFNEPVGHHLELLFPSQEMHAISMIKVNHKYGSLKQRVE